MAQRLLTTIGPTLLVLSLLVHPSAADSILDPLRDLLVKAVAKFVSSSLNGSLEVGELRGSLLTGPILRNIVLRDSEGDVVGRIDEVHLRYDLKALLKKRLLIQEVDIIRPRLTIIQETDGQLNINRLSAPQKPDSGSKPPERTFGLGLPFGVDIERLQIEDGQLDLQLPSLPGVRNLEGLQARLSGRVDGEGLLLRLEQLTARATPADVKIESLRGAIRRDKGGTQFDDLRLKTKNTLFTLTGDLPREGSPIRLEVKTDPLDVTEIGRLVKNDALRGLLRATLRAEGPLEDLQVSSRMSAKGGSVALQGAINTRATPLRYRGNLAASHLDLAALLDRAALQSDINLNLHLEGEGLSPGELQGRFELAVQTSRLGSITLRPSHIDLEARPNRFQIHRFNLDTSAALMTASGLIDLRGSSNLEYRLTGNLADLRPLLGTEELGGEFQVRGEARGQSTAISSRGTVQAKNLLYQQNRLSSLQLDFEAVQLGADAEVKAQLRAQEGRFGPAPIKQIDMQATYEGRRRKMDFEADVVQSPTYRGRTQGTLTLVDASAQMVLQKLQVHFVDRIWENAGPLQFEFSKGLLDIKRFQVVHAGESIQLSGTVDGQHLKDLQLDASQVDLRAFRNFLQLPGALQGQASLRAKLSGTFGAPILQGDMSFSPSSQPASPFNRIRTTFAYSKKRFQGEVQIHQRDREVSALGINLPIDLALAGLPLEKRLLDGPVSLGLHLKHPDLTKLEIWLSNELGLSGTLDGTVSLRGSYRELTLDSDLELRELGVKGVLEQISAPLRLKASIVAGESISEIGQALQGEGLALRVTNLEMRVPDLRGEIPNPEKRPHTVQMKDFLVRAEGRWAADGLQAKVLHLSTRARGFGFPEARLALAGRWTPQQLDLTQAQVRLPQSEVRARGTVNRTTEKLSFRFDIPQLRLDELAGGLPARLPPEVRGRLELRGSLKAPEIVANLEYAGGELSGDLSAKLRNGLPRYSGTVRMDGLDAARFLSDVQGRLQARLRLEGTGFSKDNRRARLSLTVDSTAFSLAPGFKGQVEAGIDGGSIRLESLRLQSLPGDLTAQGEVSADEQMALTYSLTIRDLTSLQHRLGSVVQARGRISGEVEGRISDLQARGTMQLTEWSYAEFHGKSLLASFSATNLPLGPRGTLRAEIVDVEGPSLSASSLRLSAEYKSPQGTFEVGVTKGPYEKTEVAGDVILNELQQLTLHRLHLQHDKLAWENPEPIQVARDSQGTLHVKNLLLRSGEQEIRAQGTLADGEATSLKLGVNHLQIRPTVHAFAPGMDIPEGQLALDLTLKGRLKQLNGEGSLKLTALRWQEQDLGEVSAQIGLTDQSLRTDLVWENQDQEILKVNGTVGRRAGAALALRMQASDLDIEKLPFSSRQILKKAGTLQVNLQLEGTWKQPQVYGDLELRDGVLRLRATGERYQGIQSRVLFTGNRAEVQRLQVKSQNGDAQLTGWIESAGLELQKFDLTMKANDFEAIQTPNIEAVVTGSMALRGSPQEMSATGNITIPRGRYRLTGELGGGPADVKPWELTVQGVYGPGPEAVKRAGGKAGAPEPKPWVRSLHADLAVDIPRNVWLRGSGTAVEVSGKLQVTKAPERPFVLIGTIQTVRGFASFYTKRFNLEKGSVTFTGSEEINPILDVTATQRVSNYVINIRAEGKAKKPQLALSSVPPLDNVDILSLLLVGKTTDRLTNSEQNALSKEAQNIGGSLIAKQLEEVIGSESSLGLDTFEISGGDKLGSGAVSVGRYVTQDLFLSYEREFGEKNVNSFGVEYSFTPNLKVKGSSSDLGDTAVDFLWRIDY